MIHKHDGNKDIYEKIPSDVLDKLKIHLGNLEASLLKFDPEMPNHLRESHRLLITYPESTVLLDDNEIAKLIEAAEKHTNVQITKETASGKGSAKSKKKIEASDL